MAANKFLPKLSSVINLDFLPEQLGFIEGGIDSIIGKVYLKEVQFVKSNIGDSISVFVVLKIFKKLGYEMPGTGFEILVNAPSGGNPNCLEIPLSFDFQLGILKYVPDFSMESFAFGPESMFNLMLDILDISEEELLFEAVNICGNGSINYLVDAINEQYNLTGTSNEISYPSSNNVHQAIQELITSIGLANLGIDIFQVIFEACINSPYSNNVTTQNINNLFASLLGNSPIDTLLDLLYPNFHVNLSLSLSIVIPRKVLLPMTVDGVIPPEETEKVVLTFDPGEFNFTSSGSVGFSESVHVSFPPQYPKAQIGKTGLTLTFDYAKIDFSRNSNIVEATAAGYDDDFIGIFINQLGIGLPEKWFNSPDFSTAQIIGRDILIGTGGFSGTIALEIIGTDPDSAVTARLGNSDGFELGFQSFDVVFKQNSIISSNIRGFLKIKGFKDAGGEDDAVIQILGHICENGDFFITAYETDGVEALRIPDILQLNLHSLTIGKRDDRFYVAVSGKLDFDQKGGAIGQFLPKDVEITKLLIWSDGSWEFEGGALVLPTKFSLPMGPVKLSISALHIGSDERNGVKYKYVGFDGGLSINPAGIDARGDGLKYYFTEDGSDHFFRIEGIGIDMILPGNVSEDKAALLFSGYLAVKEGGDNGVEYAGNVAFALPKLNISGSAGMRYLPDVPAFLVDAGLSLSTPIPIASTGLGIYGFEALFGKHFVVSKSEEGLSDDAPWFEYYKKQERGLNRDKFYPIGGTSLGAGVLLGTSGDSGFTHSGRLFFLLSLPGVFFLEGEAQILKKRTGFASNTTPPFYAFIAITNSSIEAALGVDYKMPSATGDIAHVRGAMELGFFFGNSTGWYLNIGRESSEAKRVQAKLLRIINRAYFYLMISSSGIRVGAGAGMDFDRKFGPAKVKIKAYLDQAGRISFRPLQIGGTIQAGIEGSVKIFGVGMGVSAHFGLSVDAPKPFIISGEVRVCVRVIVKKCVNVPFKWVLNEDLNVVELPLLESSSVSAVNVHTGETYPVAFDVNPENENVIPLDTYVDIEFKHAVNPNATSETIGGIVETPIYKELLPPKKSRAPQLTYDFKVKSVNFVSGNAPSGGKVGFWQWNAPGHYTKIRLLSLSPLSFMSNGVLNGPSWSSDYAVTNMDCVGTTIDETCVNFGGLSSNGLFPSQTLVVSDGVGFILSSGLSGTISGSLRYGSGQTLTIYFAEPTAIAHLAMLTETNSLTIKYYERVSEPDTPLIYEDVLVQMEDYVGPTISEIDLNYENPENPIQKIVITTGACNLNIGSGSADPNDLPCSEQIMADLVGLLNGLHKAGEFFPTAPLEVNTQQWVAVLYKYLLGDTFNLCTKSRACPGSGNLLNDLLTILPEVTVEYFPLGDNYGEYVIDIPDCIKFRVKFFFSDQYKNAVSSFECLQAISDISTGELIFSGQALLNDGISKIPIRGCITVEFPNSTYGEIDNCSSELLRLCYQTLANYQYNELVIETNSLNTVGDDINVISGSVGQVIWEPDQIYDVEVITQTKVYKDGTTELASFDESHNVKFRTEGPPGFFHKFSGAGEAYHPQYAALPVELQDKFKQRTLLHYIDFATSYPNADGNLINAKPIFYSNVNLGLYFERAYIRTMYSSAYQLTLKIKDPAVSGADSDVVFGQWVEGPIVDSSEATIINDILGPINCIAVNTIQNNSQGAIFVKDLEPLKCYTAIFSASDGEEEREVHRYVFETSRYASLIEMVNSYQIEDEEGLTTSAAFIVEGDWGGVIIPSGNSEDVLAYEQAVIGILGLSDLPPATTTEFLLLKSGNSIIGVLVRNPEPFNNPKMPVSVLEDGVDITVNGIALATKIVAKDSSAILFPGGGSFPTDGLVSIDATFRYKTYNPDTQDYDNATESISFTKQF